MTSAILTLCGYSGADAELRATASGQPICSFSVGNTVMLADNKTRTDFYKIVMFGKMAETTAKIVKKGDMVLVTGNIRFNQWVDKEGVVRHTVEIWPITLPVVTSRASDRAAARATTVPTEMTPEMQAALEELPE